MCLQIPNLVLAAQKLEQQIQLLAMQDLLDVVCETVTASGLWILRQKLQALPTAETAKFVEMFPDLMNTMVTVAGSGSHEQAEAALRVLTFL